MSETLEFPTIDADAIVKQSMVPAETQPLKSALAPATDLTKIDLTDVALAMYGKWPDEVAAVKSNLSTLALDLSTASKITEARALRKRLILDPLAAARKVSAGIKSKMAQTSKAVGAELEKIEKAYTEADALILPKIEEREAELAAEKLERERKEAERKAAHQAKIAHIRAYAVKAETAPDMTAARVATAIQQLEALPTPDKATFEEFAVEAANAICETLEKLRIIHARLLRAEQAEAEAAELRAKLAEQNTPQQGANRDASAEQSHVAEGSASPTGRGADGPTAGGAAPVFHTREGQASQQVLKAEPATADATDRDAPAVASPSVGSMGAGQAADAAPAGGLKPPVFTDIEPVEPAAPADEKPTVTLGQLNAWLGFLVSVDFLAKLGFTAHKEGAARLYKPSDKARIKAKLIEHLEGLQ